MAHIRTMWTRIKFQISDGLTTDQAEAMIKNLQSKQQPPPPYDSLTAEGIPYEGPYLKSRYLRSRLDAQNAIEHSSEIIVGPDKDYPFPKGKISDELEKYSDKDLARLLDNIARAHYECRRIIDQVDRILNDPPLIENPEQNESQQELLHFYVYVPAPCQQRLIAIYKLMELIVTDLLFRDSHLGSNIQQLGHSVFRKAKEIDKKLRPLKALPYWNERNYTGSIAEFREYVQILFDKLNHIGQLLEKDLTFEKPSGTEQKEIVEVKPCLFGITVDIKELAKRFRKWICSRRKD